MENDTYNHTIPEDDLETIMALIKGHPSAYLVEYILESTQTVAALMVTKEEFEEDVLAGANIPDDQWHNITHDLVHCDQHVEDLLYPLIETKQMGEEEVARQAVRAVEICG